MHRENGDRSGEGTTLNNLAQIYQARGDYASALDLPAQCQLPGSSWVGYFSSLKLGRKMVRGGKPRYLALLDDLANDLIYSPGSIARATLATAKSRYNCRHALILYARYWGFPKHGDGIIRLKGQADAPGWFGWRWKFPFLQNETVAEETVIEL